MTRVLFALALLTTVVCGYLALRQSTSMILRQELPRSHWPHGNASQVGGWIHGRGYVTYTGRSEWAGFRGGGPGHAK